MNIFIFLCTFSNYFSIPVKPFPLDAAPLYQRLFLALYLCNIGYTKKKKVSINSTFEICACISD